MISTIPKPSVEDAEFYALFNGKEDVFGGSQTYTLAVAWLMSEMKPNTILRKISTCITFSEKPKKFLITGHTRSGNGDGNGVAQAVFKYVPMHEAGFLEELQRGDQADRKAYQSRMAFPEYARLINFTMIKNVVMIAMEGFMRINFLPTKLMIQWAQMYGEPPSRVKYTLEMAKGNEESHSIKAEVFSRFQGNSMHWAESVDVIAQMADQIQTTLSKPAAAASQVSAASAASAGTPKETRPKK
jgi:hypothetical protein